MLILFHSSFNSQLILTSQKSPDPPRIRHWYLGLQSNEECSWKRNTTPKMAKLPPAIKNRPGRHRPRAVWLSNMLVPEATSYFQKMVLPFVLLWIPLVSPTTFTCALLFCKVMLNPTPEAKPTPSLQGQFKRTIRRVLTPCSYPLAGSIQMKGNVEKLHSEKNVNIGWH